MECIKCGMEMKKVNLFGLPGVNMTLSQGVPNWQGYGNPQRCALPCLSRLRLWQNCRPLNLTNSGEISPHRPEERTHTRVKAWLNSRR